VHVAEPGGSACVAVYGGEGSLAQLGESQVADVECGLGCSG